MQVNDGKIPGSPEPEEATPLPLSPNKVSVTRFSRRVMVLIIALVGGITAFSLIIAFTPKKQPSPQEKAAQQEVRASSGIDSPTPAECITAGPGSYGEAKKASVVYSTPGNGVPLLGPPHEPGLQLNGAGNLTYVAHDATGQRAGSSSTLTPEQQAVLAREELRRKEALEARRSALTFEGGQSGSAPGAAAGNHGLAAASPALERLEGLANRIRSAGPGASDATVDPDQNRQEEKREFAREKRNDSPYLQNLLLRPVSPFEVKAGSILPATLITGINSDLPGQIVAQLRENVFDTVSGNYLLLPQGTKLIGEYDSKISYGQERVLVVWSRLIMPNGNSINLEGMPGIDLSGYSGATGRVNNHYGKLITGVVLGTVIGAGAQIATGGQGSPNTPASFGQLAVSGAAENINQAGQEITSKNLNLQPTIEVPPGLKINVFVTKDLILKPFQD
jgi:type IV secretory pathway VirB10-like protein